MLGASRGLGRSFLEILHGVSAELIVASRRPPEAAGESRFIEMDFAREEFYPEYLTQIEEIQPDRVLYFAGGGPHGGYTTKAWKDHLWAWRVSFLFPSYLLHRLALPEKGVKQLVFVGSEIAENEAHPQGASYAAAKCALRSLIESVVAAQSDKKGTVDLRLLSPGYMDTDLLPVNAPVRETHKILSPTDVARRMALWASDEKAHWHLRLPSL